jgi:hypothetical protein
MAAGDGRTRAWLPLISMLAVLAAQMAILAPGPALRGEILTAAALAYTAEPWSRHLDRIAPHATFNTILSDDLDMFAPWDASLRRRSGGTPLWNPDSACGAPMLANDQSALLAPSQSLRWVWNSPRARTIGLLLVPAIAATGLYAFLVALGIGRWSAALAGLAWAGAACMQVWLLYPLSETTAWFSWLAAGVAGTLTGRRGRWRWRLAAGAGLAAVLLAGHLPTAGQFLTVGAVLTLTWLAVSPAARRNSFRLFVPLLAGALLAAPQVLPTLEYYEVSRARSVRSGAHEGPAAAAETLDPGASWSWLVAAGFGTPHGSGYTGPLNFNEATAHVGPPALLLALLATGSRRRRLAAAFGLTALVCAVTAYGIAPVADLLATLPVLAWAPGIRWIVIAQWAVCCLAALGADCVLSRPRTRRWLPTTAAAAALLLATSLHPATTGSGDSPPAAALAVAASASVLALAAVATLAAPLLPRPLAALCLSLTVVTGCWGAFRGFHPSLPPELMPASDRATELLGRAAGDGRVVSVGWVFPRNTNLFAGLASAQGWDAINLERVVRYGEAAGWAPRNPPAGRVSMNSDMLRRAAVRVVVADRDVTAPGLSRLEIGERRELHAYRFEGSHPLVGWYPHAIPASDLQEALRLLSSRGGVPRDAVVVELDPGEIGVRAESSPHRPIAVAYERVSPELLRIDAVVPAEGWLVFREALAPGWRATINGRSRSLVPADGAFMGLHLPAGRSEIELRYSPASFVAGSWAAAAGSLLLAITIVGSAIRERRVGRPRFLQARHVRAIRPHASVVTDSLARRSTRSA